MILLEEELNYSKKQSRSQINALMKEAGQARTQVRNRFSVFYTLYCYQWLYIQDSEALEKKNKRLSWQLPPISLDVGNMERQFSEADEAKRMIVHEQLKAMERWDDMYTTASDTLT